MAYFSGSVMLEKTSYLSSYYEIVTFETIINFCFPNLQPFI